VVETTLRGILLVLRNNDLQLAHVLRAMDGIVDSHYSAIKFYLTQISNEALSQRESRRWADIVSFTINMKQTGDIIERVLQDIEDKKVRKNRSFSDAGMAEIVDLHQRLQANLRVGMSVFLEGNVRDAKKLLEEKARFSDLEHEYAAKHIGRLQDDTAQSIKTSSLHLGLLSELKRINSRICPSRTRSWSRPARCSARASATRSSVRSVSPKSDARGALKPSGNCCRQRQSGACIACSTTCASPSRSRLRSHQTAPFLIAQACGTSASR